MACLSSASRLCSGFSPADISDDFGDWRGWKHRNVSRVLRLVPNRWSSAQIDQWKPNIREQTTGSLSEANRPPAGTMDDGRWRLERGGLCVVPLHIERGAFDREKRPWPILPCQSATDPPQIHTDWAASQCIQWVPWLLKRSPPPLHSPLYGRRWSAEKCSGGIFMAEEWNITWWCDDGNSSIYWLKWMWRLYFPSAGISPTPSNIMARTLNASVLISSVFLHQNHIKVEKSSDVISITITFSKLLFPLCPSTTSSCLDPPWVK